MSDFTDLISQGFAAMIDQVGSDITVGALTKKCVISSPTIAKDLRDTGLWENVTAVAELTRSDFAALGVQDRSAVTIDSRRYIVGSIDDDPSDPCVRLRLKISHA